MWSEVRRSSDSDSDCTELAVEKNSEADREFDKVGNSDVCWKTDCMADCIEFRLDMTIELVCTNSSRHRRRIHTCW